MPGGHRVATDEIFALYDHVQQVRGHVTDTSDTLRLLARRVDAHSVDQAQQKTDQWLEWSQWFLGALDRYCQDTAEAERLRTSFWEKPRDYGLLALLRGLSGDAQTRGAEPRSALDDAAAIAHQWFPPSGEAKVLEVDREPRVAVSSSLAERIARIPDTETPVRIERYVDSSGERWTEVFIAGTDTFSLGATDTPFDMASNLALVAGVGALSTTAALGAMNQAGVKPGDRVLFVGHSQGGAIARTLAESGAYTTAGLVTVGAPTGSLPVRGDYPALTVEHTDDLVPRLSGARVDTEAIVVRTTSGAAPGDLISAHAKDGYVDTAQRIDQSPSGSLSRFTSQFPRGLAGDSVTFSARVG